MARYKYRVVVEPKNRKDLDVMFDSLDNILNDPSEYEGKFEYGYLNDKSFYVDFALSMDANVFATTFDPKLVNISSSINESKISADAINAEVLKPDFYGAVLIYCDNGSKSNKVVMYPAGINEFRVCDYDRYNPRILNARDTKIQAKTLIDGLEIIQSIWGEIFKVVPLNRNESVEKIEIKEEPINMTDNLKEDKFNYYRFAQNIPGNMRYKEARIEGDILYWVTQDSFNRQDLAHFIDALEDTFMTKAFVIVRDDSTYELKRDIANGYGIMIDLTKTNYIIPGYKINDSCIILDESVIINNECKIPGTDIILETGDKIHIVSKKTEDIIKDDEVIFEDSNFIFKKHYFIDHRKEEHFDYRVVTKRGSVADDYVVEIYVEQRWDNPEIPESVFVKYGLPGSMLNKSISIFINVLQNAIKFADKVAAYLKIKVINK